MPASIASLDVASGEPVWQRFFESFGVDIVDVVDDVVVVELVIGTSGHFLGIDSATGAIRWDLDFETDDGVRGEDGTQRFERTEYRGMHDGVLVTETSPSSAENQWEPGERRRVDLTDPATARTIATVPNTDGVWVLDEGIAAIVGEAPSLLLSDGSTVWTTPDVLPAGELVSVGSIEQSASSLVVTASSPTGGTTVVALAVDTGSLRWRRDRLANAQVTPGAVLIESVEGQINVLTADTGEDRWHVTATDGLSGYVGHEDNIAYFLVTPRQMRALDLMTGATPLGSLDGDHVYWSDNADHVGMSQSVLVTDFGDVVDPTSGDWTEPRSNLFAHREPDWTVIGTTNDAGLVAFVTESIPECPPG